MIDSEILQERASRLDVVATDDDVNARLTEMKASFTQEEFDKWLKQRNQTLDDLKRDLRNSLTQNKLINKEIESKINITDAEISGYYATHKAEFNLSEPLYHFARIVVDDNPDANNRIHTLRDKLENGEEFSVIAMKYSTDRETAPNGGDIGFVSESQLPEALRAITKLKPGQFSEVVPFFGDHAHGDRIGGYAVYEMIARELPGQREQNDPRVQQLIRQRLRENHSQLLKNAYFEVLRNEARIHNYLANQILEKTSR
jgi:peptidyl-prolyl cis-trans isomerase SurA